MWTQVLPPVVTSSDCEGAGEVFTLATRGEGGDDGKPMEHDASTTSRDADADITTFFRSPKYLTVSAQLHLEAYSAALGNVWTLSPTFRAEPSDTPRHLSEFYMLEAEMNFVPSLSVLLDVVERLLRGVVGGLHQSAVVQELLAGHAGYADGGPDPATLAVRWTPFLSSDADPWPRITYSQAVDALAEEARRSDGARFHHGAPVWGAGLQFEHEKWLAGQFGGGVRPVFVTDYPREAKPFYMAASEGQAADDYDKRKKRGRETVAGFDLLLPVVGEVAGGSMREHRLDALIANMRTQGMVRGPSGESSQDEASASPYPFLAPGESLEPLRWYADLRRWGSAPHGGFGLGLDRLLGYLTGVSSLRDVVAFPRYAGRADC